MRSPGARKMTTNHGFATAISRSLATVRQRLASLARFSFVGLLATTIYLIVANTIMVSGVMPPAWASLTAYLSGMVFSFLGQSQFTFRRGRATFAQAARFAVLSVCGIATSFGCVYVLSNFANIDGLPATLITAAIIALLSFVMMNIWVFRPAPPTYDEQVDGGGTPSVSFFAPGGAPRRFNPSSRDRRS